MTRNSLGNIATAVVPAVQPHQFMQEKNGSKMWRSTFLHIFFIAETVRNHAVKSTPLDPVIVLCKFLYNNLIPIKN